MSVALGGFVDDSIPDDRGNLKGLIHFVLGRTRPQRSQQQWRFDSRLGQLDMCVLRPLDTVLEPTKQAVLDMKENVHSPPALSLARKSVRWSAVVSVAKVRICACWIR